MEDLEQALTLLAAEDEQWLAIQRYLAKLARARGDLDLALNRAASVEKHWPAEGALLHAELLLDVGQPVPALDALTAVHLPNATIISWPHAPASCWGIMLPRPMRLTLGKPQQSLRPCSGSSWIISPG